MAVLRPGRQHAIEWFRAPNLRHREALALLGRGDRVRGEALAIEPFGLGARGHHRDKGGDPELGSLLDQPVHPQPLYWREEQPQIGFRLDLAKPGFDRERAAVAPQFVDSTQKLA